MFERGLTALSSLQKRKAFIIPTPPPPTERQQSHQDISLFGYSLAPVYDFWERLQVSHCGQYSVERMLALDEYCQRVSIIRVLAVCLFFPFGPLIVIVMTECMPLEAVDKGALANYVFWIRHAIMGTILVFCAMIQAKVWIPEVPLSVKQVLMVAIGSSVLYTALNILVAELWVFPIPFLVVAGAPVLISIWAIASRLVLGPHPVEGVQDGSFRGRRVLLLTAVHASLLAIYPAYQAVFLEVDGFLELAMFALLPVINLSLKNLQTALGSHLEDSLPEVIIFSVDVFNAIYSVLCMHSANSIKMVALTLVLNTFVLILSLHGMNRRSRVARECRSFQLMERQQQQIRRTQSVLDSVVTGGYSPALLSTLVTTTLRMLQAPGQLDTHELRTIRLLSGMPHQLSSSSSALLDSLAGRSVYNNNRRTTVTTCVAQIKSRFSSAAVEGRVLSATHFPPLRGTVLVVPTHDSSRTTINEIETSACQQDKRDESTSTKSETSDTQPNSAELLEIPMLQTLYLTTPHVKQVIHAMPHSIVEPIPSLPGPSRLWISLFGQEVSDKLIPLVSKNNPFIGTVLDETRKLNTRAVKQTLQLLFNNEYLGLMAYTQCIIPVVYLLYMPILQALPNHVYYPTHYRYFGGENEFDERMTVIGILAGLQFAVLMALQVFVVKCFGVSTIYQIAFVLETHFSLLQGRLLMWLVFAVQSTLMHYGADFSFRFDWLHKSSPAN
ncbi:hypothetical protein PI124_g20113 [Phytophthora idaei]|nr:hypothetical protein PI126_g19549 [Phytophthora idaei]KAG3234838.1 hypothetical protein PI124_g20113 [Phytophthora idaei]